MSDLKTFMDIVRSVLPECSDAEAGYVLWNETGYPVFWDDDDGDTPMECCRTQVARYRDQLATPAAAQAAPEVAA